MTGTVDTANPLTVRLDGATTAVSALRLTSYTAVVDDRVLIAQEGSQLVVLGKLA